jgi:hypothetical protein
MGLRLQKLLWIMGFCVVMGFARPPAWLHKKSMGLEGLWVYRCMGSEGFDCNAIIVEGGVDDYYQGLDKENEVDDEWEYLQLLLSH